MRHSPKHMDRFFQLGKAIRFNLKNGKSFHLATTSKEYWRGMIERDIEDCSIEDVDDGIVVRK